MHHDTALFAPVPSRLFGIAPAPASAAAVVYQPAVDLADRRIVAAELLPDWPRRPAQDKRGAVSRGRAVRHMRAACAAAMGWPDSVALWLGLPVGGPRTRDLPGEVGQILRDSGLAPQRLVFGVPEALAVDDTDGLLGLSALRDLGVGVQLTGFGAWVGSLTALRRLPLTAIRLDRGLVRGVPEEPDDLAILRGAVEAARRLGLAVSADGIETETQRDFLAAIGCGIGQGVLFSHPLPGDQLCLPACLLPPPPGSGHTGA